MEETADLSDAKEEILGKQKKERLNQEQRKIRGKSRLSFDDGNGMVQGSGMGFGRKARVTIKDAAFGAAGKAAGAAGFAAHAKLSEAEDENVGTQAAHEGSGDRAARRRRPDERQRKPASTVLFLQRRKVPGRQRQQRSRPIRKPPSRSFSRNSGSGVCTQRLRRKKRRLKL